MSHACWSLHTYMHYTVRNIASLWALNNSGDILHKMYPIVAIVVSNAYVYNFDLKRKYIYVRTDETLRSGEILG